MRTAQGLSRTPPPERERVAAHRARVRERSVAVPRVFCRAHRPSRPDLTAADLDHLGARASWPTCSQRGTRSPRRRGSSPRSARSDATSAAKGSSKATPPLWWDAEARAADPGTPCRRRDGEAAGAARRPVAARPPRPAILELFYASGLRLSELVGLDLDDSTCPDAWSACSARAARSASSRSTRRRRMRCARGLRIARSSRRRRTRLDHRSAAVRPPAARDVRGSRCS